MDMPVINFIGQHNRSARLINSHGPYQLPVDEYYLNILASAKKMVDQGKGDWLYVTQFSSGHCQWVAPLDSGISTIE